MFKAVPDVPIDPRGRCFLAYRSTHEAQIRALADALDLVGVPVWLDLREQPSGPIWSEIELALQSRGTSAAVVWLCSKTPEASPTHRREMSLAIRRALATQHLESRFRTHVFVTDDIRPSRVTRVLKLPWRVHFAVKKWLVKSAPAGPGFNTESVFETAGLILKHRLQDVDVFVPREDPIHVGLYAYPGVDPPRDAHLALCIWWSRHLPTKQVGAEVWQRLLAARDLVVATLRTCAHGRTIVFQGSATLSATLTWGHAFSTTSGMTARWSPAPNAPLWGADVLPEPFETDVEETARDPDGEDLAVEVSLSNDVRPAVAASPGLLPRLRAVVRIQPSGGSTGRHRLSAGQAVTIARQVRESIRSSHGKFNVRGCTHLFLAGPTGLAFLIGQFTNALGPIQMYELDQSGGTGRYVRSVLLKEPAAT